MAPVRTGAQQEAMQIVLKIEADKRADKREGKQKECYNLGTTDIRRHNMTC